MPKISFAGVTAAIPRLDDPDILHQAENSPEVYVALNLFRPRNWWGAGISAHTLQRFAHDSGIPVAWVPRTAILAELAGAPDAEARTSVLLANETAIADDCHEALQMCWHPSLLDEATIARRALVTYRAGYHEAAMALAVALGEPLAKWWSVRELPETFDLDERRQALAKMINDEKEAWKKLTEAEKKAIPAEERLTSAYQAARFLLAQAGADPSRAAFRWDIVAAPIPKFFTGWFDGTVPPPKDLSRHVMAHRPTTEHLNRRNALVSQMFITSLLRERQHWAGQLQDSYDIALED